MNYDIILCGVGGQGIVSLASIITNSAASEGLQVKQVEVHGMAQRGGMVLSNLRLSDQPIQSDQIPLGTAHLILSTEPLESLRSLRFLSPDYGILITAREEVKNFPAYPDSEELYLRIKNLPRSHIVNARHMAAEAGSHHTINMVILGVASAYLPIPAETLREQIGKKFKDKSSSFMEINIRAFNLGRKSNN